MTTITNKQTRYGYIQSLRVGMGGRDDNIFGVDFTLSGRQWGAVRDFIPLTTEGGVGRVIGMMNEAQVFDIGRLVNKPVELQFDANALRSWRLFTEAMPE